METQDIKEKILSVLRINGPSLPVHIAKAINQSTLFASAFLSELISDKKIKMSKMRVGSSPIYFILGQEPKLEKFSEHLKSKEKEAFLLLKEKKILKDSIQQPAIRVALREIKDFAIAFKKNNEIFWRYFTIPETELKEEKAIIKKNPILENKQKKEQEIEQNEKETKQEIEILKKEDLFKKDEQKKEFLQYQKDNFKKTKKELNIFDEPNKIKIPKRQITKKRTKTNNQKRNNKFFNKVKEFLSKKQIEILEIESFSKNDILFRVKIQEQEKLLVAYNKKRIKEEEIISAYKKASELNLKYIILSFGEPLKKLNNLIQAIKNLEKIEKIN